MTVEHRCGDLFEQGFTALAHGVNCHGLMGAGIAREFRRRWPVMYPDYQRVCRRGWLRPGGLHTWRASDGTVVYNLATQDRPGRHATLDAVRESVTRMVDDAGTHDIIEIGMPQVGCGIGGLAWPDVAAILDEAAGECRTRLVVMSFGNETTSRRAVERIRNGGAA